jgi:hypothetical protein
VVWIGAAIATIALYVPGYQTSRAFCRCAQLYNPRQASPVDGLSIFFALIGNVIPGGGTRPVHSVVRFELVGVVLFASAVFIIVQSWRQRSSTERLPIPLLLIIFSLAFDVSITLGREGAGPTGAVNGNRFIMPNLILLVAIVMYAWAHFRRRPSTPAGDRWRSHLASSAFIVLAILFIVQVTVATGFGFLNGRGSYTSRIEEARQAVNQDRLPARYAPCEVCVESFFSDTTPQKVRVATDDGLGEFRPGLVGHYRELGQPPLYPACLTAVPPRASARTGRKKPLPPTTS